MGKRLAAEPAKLWNQPEYRRAALTALLAAAAFSFAAHGFLFANEFFSHDSVSYFTYATGSFEFYTSIGRFFIPVYEVIKGDVAAPWLIGLLFILWMTLSALLAARLLEIKTTGGIVLTSGLLCTNQALTLTGATYIYCMDEYAFALFTALAAARLFSRRGWQALLGLLPLAISLAVYQAYFTVAASMCLLAVMKGLAAGKSWKGSLFMGLRYLALLAAGFAAYYGTWTAVCALTGAAKRRVEESLLGGGSLPALLWDANVEYVRSLFDPSGVLGWLLPAVHVLLVCLLAYHLAELLRDRELPVGNKVLLVLLACLAPTAFNSIHILLSGTETQLMTFAWELPYLLLVLGREPGRRQWCLWRRRAALALVCCVLWQHVVYANQVYMKKELDKNATIALAARVIDEIEEVEGYVPGETPVAFAGRLDRNEYLNRGRDEFAALDHTVGLWSDYAATYNLGRYLTDYLNYPLLWDTETDVSQWPEVQAMSAFPAAESVQMIGGTVVVKLS